MEAILIILLAWFLLGGQKEQAPLSVPPSFRLPDPPHVRAAVGYLSAFAVTAKATGMLDLDFVKLRESEDDQARKLIFEQYTALANAIITAFQGNWGKAIGDAVGATAGLVDKSMTREAQIAKIRKIVTAFVYAYGPPPVSLLIFGYRWKPKGINVTHWDLDLPYYLLDLYEKAKEKGYDTRPLTVGEYKALLNDPNTASIMNDWREIDPPSGRSAPPFWYCFSINELFQREARLKPSIIFLRQLQIELDRPSFYPFELPAKAWHNAFDAAGFAAGTPPQQSLIFEIGHSPFWNLDKINIAPGFYTAYYTVQRNDPRWFAGSYVGNLR